MQKRYLNHLQDKIFLETSRNYEGRLLNQGEIMNPDRKKIILLVEDQAIILIAKSKTLKKNGFDVLVASSGKEAIKIARNNSAIDLILMDIDLGKGMDGTEAAQIILHDREIPIVFLSSHTEKEIVHKTEKITSYGYVVKNSGETVLIASIRMAFKLFEANQKIKNELRERKQTEEALRASKEKLKKIVEDTNALLFNVDKNGRITYINETVASTVGYSREEMIDRFYLRFVYPEDRKQVHDIFVKQLNGAVQNSIFEFRYIKKNGTFGWLSFLTNQIYQDEHIIGLNGVAQDITVRKQMEKELRENEERYRSIVENLNQAYYEADRRGVFTYCNPGLILISGYSEKELLGTISFNLVAEENRKQIVASYKQSLRQKETHLTTEFKVQTKNGQKFWVEQATHFEFDENGTFLNATNIIRNIDDRKQAEEALWKSEQRLRYALEGSSDGIWDWNLKTGEVYFSPRYYSMLGFKPNEFLPGYEKWKELLHPEDVEKTIWSQREAIEKLIPFEVEFRLRKKDGSYCWILSRGKVAEIDTDGKALRITGSHSDIEKRKIAEQALIETQQMLRSVLNNIPVRVFWKDINSNYLGCNLPFALDAGLKSPEEIVGKDDFCMGWKDQAQLYRQDDHQVMISGESRYNYEEPQTRKDRKINWLRTNKIPLKDLKGNIIGVLGTYEDITEKKLAEEALRNNENKLKSIFKVAPIGIGVTTNRVLLEVNDQICNMTGYTSKELIGNSARILYPTQEEFEFVGKEKYGQIEKFGTGSVETKWKCKDGRIIDVLLSSTPLNINAIMGGVTFTALDITQRKQTEELIKESEANLNSMINNRFESIWSIDKNYNYIIFNNFFKEAYLKAYGIELKKGMNALQILAPGLIEFWKPKYQKAMTGENVVFEFTNQVDDELYFFEVSLDPIISENNVIGVSGLSVDITARKQAEQFLKNAAAEKEALHRELLHRVKNSFNQIKSILYFEREKVAEPKANKILENLEMRVGTLAEMYSMLNASGVSELINLGQYLEQITKSLKESFVKDEDKIIVKTSLDLINTTPKIASSVGLIINELLTNSYKYAFPGRKKGIISVILRAKNKNAEVEITDSGIGLPADFDIEKSTGMGLQLVNLLVCQLSGKLTVESKKGTTFKFVFPIDE